MFDNLGLNILEFFNKMEENYSYDRAKRTKNILCNIITSAFDSGIITKNPCSAQSIKNHSFPETTKKTEAYTSSEAKKMLSQAICFPVGKY